MNELKEELEKRPVVVQESSKTAEKVPEQEEPAPVAAKQPTKEQVWDLHICSRVGQCSKVEYFLAEVMWWCHWRV